MKPFALSVIVVALGAASFACSAVERADPPGSEIPPAAGGERTGSAGPLRDEPPATPPAKPAAPTPITTAAPSDVAAPPPDATRLPSGLAYKTLRKGDGALANPSADVTVHYAGWTTDGALFDASVARGEPLRVGLTRVIEGWRVGVGSMQVGEVRRLWIPQELAYQGKAGAPAGTLVFDVELIAVEAD